MVADCGEGPSGNGQASAMKLSNAVRGSYARIETLVVTHFDADHWQGLKAYPGVAQSQGQLSSLPRYIDIRVPRLPRVVSRFPAAQLVLETTRELNTNPLSATLDLRGAWQCLGVNVRVHATRRGDNFHAAGENWRVHWPPKDTKVLPKATQKAIKKLNRDIDRLAERVPKFSEALDIAYGAGWSNESSGIYYSDEQHLTTLPSSLTVEQLAKSIEDYEVNNKSAKVNNILKRLRYYNNAFSLVHDAIHEDGTGKFINFGDCQGPGLNSLLRLQCQPNGLSLASSYERLLAPHHGTISPAKRIAQHFPQATASVVAQNGAKHYKNQDTTFLKSLSQGGQRAILVNNTFKAKSSITFSV